MTLKSGTNIITSRTNNNILPILSISLYSTKLYSSIEDVDRIIGYTDELNALKQAIYHIIMTERYAYLIYDNNYGIELNQYIGKGIEYLQATIQGTLEEALTNDLRINGVEITEINPISNDVAEIKFNVDSIYGDLQMEVNVNV